MEERILGFVPNYSSSPRGVVTLNDLCPVLFGSTRKGKKNVLGTNVVQIRSSPIGPMQHSS